MFFQYAFKNYYSIILFMIMIYLKIILFTDEIA
jgi:hypothetical protein